MRPLRRSSVATDARNSKLPRSAPRPGGRMKPWGHVLDGGSPGWHLVPKTSEMIALRCPVCNTYPDEFLFTFRPEGEHLERIVRSVRGRKSVVTSTDGFHVFGDAFRQRLAAVDVTESQFRAFAPGVWAFDLTEFELVESATADESKARSCESCGRRSPIWRGGPAESVMNLTTRPSAMVVRSSELFGSAYERHPSVYVADPAYVSLNLRRHSWDLHVPDELLSSP
jgi:hypothetical protein